MLGSKVILEPNVKEIYCHLPFLLLSCVECTVNFDLQNNHNFTILIPKVKKDSKFGIETGKTCQIGPLDKNTGSILDPTQLVETLGR